MQAEFFSTEEAQNVSVMSFGNLRASTSSLNEPSEEQVEKPAEAKEAGSKMAKNVAFHALAGSLGASKKPQKPERLAGVRQSN